MNPAGDVAVLRLKREIEFNDTDGLGAIGSIRLANDNIADEEWGQLTAAGWSEQKEGEGLVDILRSVVVEALPFGLCKLDSETVICAGGGGLATCRGDSGGPLFKVLDDGTYLQVGVTSRKLGRCEESVSVFEKVASYYQKIAICVENAKCDQVWVLNE